MQQASHEIFRAIADPTRRAMLELLASADRSASDLARPFRMSQPAASQHLRVLRSAGLVQARRDGRRRLYRLRPRPLKPVVDWLAQFEAFWDDRLKKLGEYLDREET